METPFSALLELRLIYRERGKEDLPIHVSVSGVYSPPDILRGSDAGDSSTWSAIRVKVTEEGDGSELPGANPLEALEHALVHIKSFLRQHLGAGRLFDLNGNPFDPDAISSVFAA